MAGIVDFTNEEEVKEYLKNLGTEYSFQCYRERQPDGCHRLAEYFESIKKNFPMAAQILKSNCEETGYSDSCYKLGTYYVTGKGGLPADVQAAYNCFLKSCNKEGKKSLAACQNVAILLHEGHVNDKKPDTIAARDYYTKACEGDVSASCFNLSTIYLQGTAEIAKDMGKAVHYAERACALGHVWGCANASRMYKLGDGIDKDDTKAETLKNRAKKLFKQEKEAQQITFGE